MNRIAAFYYVSFFSCLLFIGESCNSSQASQPKTSEAQEQYQCLPCGSECDKTTHNAAGECSRCHMQLVKKSSVKHHSIAPSAICDYIKKHPEAILLDVRSEREFEGKTNPKFGTLKNAINIPIQELENKLSTISHLKNKEVLVYCSHSQRSPRASYLLIQNGFTNVTNMEGGMSVVTDTACKNRFR